MAVAHEYDFIGISMLDHCCPAVHLDNIPVLTQQLAPRPLSAMVARCEHGVQTSGGRALSPHQLVQAACSEQVMHRTCAAGEGCSCGDTPAHSISPGSVH